MLLEKVYTVTVDVRDPEVYCASPDIYLVRHLTRSYAGRCRGGAYIIRIIKVLGRSDCRMKETDLSAEGYVDVIFRALVSVISQWDIVTGVRVLNRSQIIVGQSSVESGVVASVIQTPEAETIRADQTIAVRVVRAHYPPNHSLVTVVGPMLTCDRAVPAYTVAGTLTPDDAKSLSVYTDSIRSLLEARNVLQQSRPADIAFHEGLLYSYAGAPAATRTVESEGFAAWVGPAGYEPAAPAVNVLTLLFQAASGKSVPVSGVWCRDLALCRSSPLVSRADTAPAAWDVVATHTPVQAFGTFLLSIQAFLKAVNEQLGVYDSADLVESHKNIWLAMRKAQLPHP